MFCGAFGAHQKRASGRQREPQMLAFAPLLFFCPSCEKSRSQEVAWVRPDSFCDSGRG